MNVLSYVMVAFALVAALDRIFGSKLGLGKEFEKGIYMLGPLAISMVGMIIMSPLIAHYLEPVIAILPDFIDPSIITASIPLKSMGRFFNMWAIAPGRPRKNISGPLMNWAFPS